MEFCFVVTKNGSNDTCQVLLMGFILYVITCRFVLLSVRINFSVFFGVWSVMIVVLSLQ